MIDTADGRRRFVVDSTRAASHAAKISLLVRARFGSHIQPKNLSSAIGYAEQVCYFVKRPDAVRGVEIPRSVAKHLLELLRK